MDKLIQKQREHTVDVTRYLDMRLNRNLGGYLDEYLKVIKKKEENDMIFNRVINALAQVQLNFRQEAYRRFIDSFRNEMKLMIQPKN